VNACRKRNGLVAAVDAAVAEMKKRLAEGELKPSVAEFTRLLELQRELIADDVRHIKVTWVDSLSGTESTTET